MPDGFTLQVDQTEPFKVEVRIGQNVLALGLAIVLATIYYKKTR